MNTYQPLKTGDEIRVIAPSMSWQQKREASYARATKVLQDAGFTLTLGKNVKDVERFGTGSVAARLQDFHDAYRDNSVKAIMAMHGGWAANALLKDIDWQLVADNPKPLIGFSDNTVLLNAVYAKTGRIQYLGPNFASLGHIAASDYSVQNLVNVLTNSNELALTRSRQWEKKRGQKLVNTRPWKVLQKGSGEGVVIGGNLGTFYLVQGTPYQPSFDKPTILAVEDDDQDGRYGAREFDRRLESLLQLPGVRDNLRGVLVGRFQPDSKVALSDVSYVLRRMQLGDIPIVADVDFGHTWPMLTLPIGGTASLTTENNQAQLNLLKY